MTSSESRTTDLYRDHVKTLVERTSSALNAAGYEQVVLHAGELMLSSRFDDMAYPFRASPAYAHWVPWAWPGSALLFSAGEAPTLLARRRTDFWERLEAPHQALVESAVTVKAVDDLEEASAFRKRKRTAFIGENSTSAEPLGFAASDVNPEVVLAELHETRVHKTAYEVAALSEANHRAVKGHRAIEHAFREGGRSELGLNLAYLSAIEQGEAETPYTNIVALGDAAAVLHHHVYGHRPNAGSLLVDAGASVRGYGSDITRTYAAETGPFSDLVEGMDALQRGLMAQIEVGKPYERLHDETHEALAVLLIEQGLVACSSEAAVQQGLTRLFFPHGLGHSLGVQVHDVGCRKMPPRSDNAFLRNTRPIEVDQVFTIEPGLYFIDALLGPLRGTERGKDLRWDRIDALRPFGGIRIEDDVYVGESGVRNLTREAFVALG